MKKGFTIIEIAVVLVIIGIIMTIGIKGKNAIEVARMRVEVAKMNRFGIAMSTVHSKFGMLPLANAGGPLTPANGYIDINIILEHGGLSEDDLQSKFDKGRYLFFRAGESVEGEYFINSPSSGYPGTIPRNMVIVNIERAHLPEPARWDMQRRMACSFETMMDDSDEATGMVRREWSLRNNNTQYPPLNYDNCFAGNPKGAAKEYVRVF